MRQVSNILQNLIKVDKVMLTLCCGKGLPHQFAQQSLNNNSPTFLAKMLWHLYGNKIIVVEYLFKKPRDLLRTKLQPKC
jgi:hypothetical protein